MFVHAHRQVELHCIGQHSESVSCVLLCFGKRAQGGKVGIYTHTYTYIHTDIHIYTYIYIYIHVYKYIGVLEYFRNKQKNPRN